ncbi:uncharacterized protein [Rutidosis leptorrhynchoides]|uniref:uncharacterized protein n=1 Tax=Rutidosis leptorrhynchoides TaxID=125765 RepID=UPI003A99DA69
MKLLKSFEIVSGLKVNFHKSCLYGIGVDNVEVSAMADRIGCKVGNFPFVYLWLPIGSKMNKAIDWDPVIEKFQSRLSKWRSKTLQFGGWGNGGGVLKWKTIHFERKSSKAFTVKTGVSRSTLFRQNENRINLGSTWFNITKNGVGLKDHEINFTDSFHKVIGNGNGTRFWDDIWVGNSTLKCRFGRLYLLKAEMDAASIGIGSVT